jgi:hypothetical protein
MKNRAYVDIVMFTPKLLIEEHPAVGTPYTGHSVETCTACFDVPFITH